MEAASGRIPVSSWNDQTRLIMHDRTRPIMHDRTLTESGHKLPEKLKQMTRRGGGCWDRTRWSAEARPMQRPVRDFDEKLQE
jgi:hypothetical protein